MRGGCEASPQHPSAVSDHQRADFHQARGRLEDALGAGLWHRNNRRAWRVAGVPAKRQSGVDARSLPLQDTVVARPNHAPEKGFPQRLAYPAAALIGLLQVVAIFPAAFLFPVAGGDAAPVGDAAQHAIAQRYFIADAWRLPLLVARNMNTPEGVNIAFADGIPLLAILLKIAAPLLPPGFHGIGLWYAVATVAQPLAAVWALRGTGERRLLPSLGVALAALAMPAWLARYGHAALTFHAAILVALGLYFRLVRRQTPGLWAGAGLAMVATLLIHPYLAAMALAVLGAVPVTLAARGGTEAIAAAAGLAGVAAALAGAMALFGYLGAVGDGGYGRYALNLLSPVWPYRSLLFGAGIAREIDATGHGGWEGYAWLGAGLLGGLALAVLLRRGAVWAALRRHAGLALVLAGLTALAVSHRVGAGERIVFDLGSVPAVLEQFRASGRFFWPVLYALLIGTVALVAGAGRAGPWLALAIGILQAIDAAPIRRDLAAFASSRQPWTLDAPALRALMAKADRLTLLPSWPCVPPEATRSFMQAHEALALASERGLPVSTMHVARWRSPPVCDDAARAAAPLGSGELRLILPDAVPALSPLVPEREARCQMVGEALACR